MRVALIGQLLQGSFGGTTLQQHWRADHIGAARTDRSSQRHMPRRKSQLCLGEEGWSLRCCGRALGVLPQDVWAVLERHERNDDANSDGDRLAELQG